ncbi:MAG: hypothetical protein IH973_01915 [Myxococcales bacterium]|nr:hypothetical protein [Myxococcales bacterium]
MCNQAVSLVAAECERQGISSVTIVLLKEVAKKVRPPRALWVPFRHGYPLDSPDQPAKQRAVIEAALALFDANQDTELPPVLIDFCP